jgi:2-dehydropantoate 2-reductase
MSLVSIVGAGAVGLALADALAKKGVPFEVVVRKERVKDLSARGLWCKRLRCSIVPIKASIVGQCNGDIVLMTPKLFALPQAIQTYLGGRGQETSVVLMQNGITADATLRKLAPKVKAFGGIVTFTSTSLKTGEVEILAEENERLVLGFGADDPELNSGIREEASFEALAPALGLHTVRSLEGARWSKLIVNLNNALFAATGLPARRVYAHPYGAWLAITAMREGLAVAKASGVRLAKIPSASPLLLRFVAALPDGAAASLFLRKAEKLLSPEMDTLGSTLQSLKRGEPTEIDELSGVIARLAKPLGVPTPLNSALTRAVQEQGRGGPAVTLDWLVDEAVGAPNTSASAPGTHRA